MLIDLNFKNFEIGTQVKTRKGFIFLKVGEDIWKDETSGLIWLPQEAGKYTYDDLLELQNESKRLPTKQEFEEAEKHGIKQIIDMENNWFWSISYDLDFPYYPYNFNGDFDDEYQLYYGSIICVKA